MKLLMRHVIGGAALVAGILLQTAPAFAQLPRLPWGENTSRATRPAQQPARPQQQQQEIQQQQQAGAELQRLMRQGNGPSGMSGAINGGGMMLPPGRGPGG